MRFAKSVLAAALLVAARVLVAAPMELERVEVKGRRIDPVPTPVGRIDDSSLAPVRSSTADSASLLRDVPGLNLRSAGGTSSLPVIFGLGGDRVRTTVDGMDLIASCPNHMNPPLSYLDPGAIGRIQVYAGITPVSAGGDSIAGSIVVETRGPRFVEAGAAPEWSGEAGFGYRDNGAAWRSDLHLAYASERFAANYSGAHAQADNYAAGGNFKTSTATGRVGHSLPLDEVGSSAYKTRNHALTLAWRGRDQLIEAQLGYQDTPFQGYPNQRMDMVDNRQQRANLRYLGELDAGTLEIRVYHEDVEHRMDFGPDRRFWYGSNAGTGSPCAPIRFMGDPAGTCAAGMPMNTASRTTGATAHLDLPLQDNDLARLGVEWQRYRLDDYWPASGGAMGPGIFTNIRDGERDRHALFAEWEAHPAGLWTTMLGLRYEGLRTNAADVQGYSSAAMAMGNQAAEAAAFNALEHQRSDHHWNLAASVRYQLAATQTLEFGLARRVRSPNLYERYAWSTWAMAASMNNTVGDGNGYVGDPALRAETAYTASATWRWQSGDGLRRLELTPFYTHVDDYIDAVPAGVFRDDQFNVLRWANQSARLWGMNLTAQTRLAESEGLSTIDLSARLQWQRGENRDSGDDLYQQMPANARLTLAQSRGQWNSALEWELVSAKTRVSDVRNEIATSGYGLLHLHGGYAWTRVRIDAGIDNLLDRGYALPLGGAYVGQGMTMSLNGVPWGIAVPGAGRTAYVGVRVNW
ncbi:MAG: TonB-dependent receptor [Lysobacterales bacterium]